MPRHQTDAPTTVVEAWGLRAGLRVWVGGHNVEARRAIEAHLAEAERPPAGPVDLGLIAPLTADEALYFAGKLRPRLVLGGVIWIVYANPRAAGEGGLVTQLDDVTVGMFERGFSERGRGALNDQFAMTGFRLDAEPNAF